MLRLFFVYTDASIIYTFLLHIFEVPFMKQGGDTERALRNVAFRRAAANLSSRL